MRYTYVPLKDRHIFTVEGEDADHFLQGLITNDIQKVTDTNTIYACMLTPQGKYLYDFFISMWQGKYFLDAGTTNPESLLRKLKMYKLRAKVDINLLSDEYSAVALIGDGVLPHISLSAHHGETRITENAVYYTDPRTPALGSRAIIKSTVIDTWCKEKGCIAGDFGQYEQLRLSLGIPDGVRDLIAEDSFPLAFGMEELHAIDFKKGCYVGQEVTARSKHRGSIKKGLFKVTANSPLPEYGSPIMAGTSKIGELLSSHGTAGLALIRLDDWEKIRESSPNLVSENIPVELSDTPK